ncbi:Ger(x)C family spore germination protein [Paenibacillus albiflavus]|uniref:Ger(X)C family spore germination protein n=1 Tax=Paenibacillus albiflavus TaxID=2545760 RepID=A0A4R4E7I0_9BACL|nr:Ger(x)C family spore germination protein [Paenibacillus albiflavus]TCZ74011.1 Ger(x)C family spore germination protein [Paenibacillus albiflavus]
MLKRSLLCLMVTLLIFVSGCWNSRELNALAIAVGMGIDKVGDQYKVSVQIVVPNEVAGKKGGISTPVVLKQATGRTIFEALRKITTVSSRKIYVSHLRILVFGESLAREGIGKVLDFLSRDPEMRQDFFIVVARQTSAENTLSVLSHLDKIPAYKLYSTLKVSERVWAPTTTVTLDKLISELVSEGTQPVLTGLRIVGQQDTNGAKKNVENINPPVKLIYSGMAVFKGDKLIGWLSEDESATYTMVINKLKSTTGTVTCPQGDGILTVEVIRAKTKVKGSIIDGQPRIHIDLRHEVNVGEDQCGLDLTKTEMITKLEEMINKKLEKYIEDNIKRVQDKYQVDIFGFGEVIHRSNPKEWKKLKKNWDQTFKSIPVTAKVTHKFQYTGNVNNSFLEQMNKSKGGGDDS